jgi:hypothetical protein
LPLSRSRRAFQVQVWAADETMARSALVRLRTAHYGSTTTHGCCRPRRQLLVRRDDRDRNGVPLATSDRAVVQKQAPALGRLGIDAKGHLPESRSRCYPFGGRMYHLLGDANTQLDWTADEQLVRRGGAGARLLGYNDFAARADRDVRQICRHADQAQLSRTGPARTTPLSTGERGRGHRFASDRGMFV